MSFRITGTGMYVPPKAVTNDDLAQIVETNDEWIQKRVGIKERRISETEFTSEMGAKAAKMLIEEIEAPSGQKPGAQHLSFSASLVEREST